TSVQVPAERVRNSTGLAVSPPTAPSHIQRASGIRPSANTAGLSLSTARASMRGRGARPGAPAAAPAAGRSRGRPAAGSIRSPADTGGLTRDGLVIGGQIHPLVEGCDLIGVAVEHQRLALGAEDAVLADAPL